MIFNQPSGSSSFVKFLQCNSTKTNAGYDVDFSGLNFSNPNLNMVSINGENIFINQAGTYKITWIGWCANQGGVGGIQFTQTGTNLPFLDGGNQDSQVYNVPESGAVQYYTMIDIPAGTKPFEININVSKQTIVTASVWVERL